MVRGGLPGGQLVTPGDTAVQSATGTFCGPINGDVKIGLGVADGNRGSAFQTNFNSTAFVDAASGAIDIRKAYHDARDDIEAMIQGIRQSLGDVVAQAFGQVKVVGMDLDLHLIPHS